MAIWDVPVSAVDRVLAVRAMPAFQGLSLAQAAALARTSRAVSFSSGERIEIGTGALDALGLIVRGGARVTGEGSGEHVRAGGPAGLLSLVARRERGTFLEFDRDTLVLLLSYDDLEEQCERHFSLVSALLAHVARHSLDHIVRLPSGSWLGRDGDARSDRLDERLNLIQRMAALAGSPAFPASQMDAISELARHVSEVAHSEGEELWRPGDRADDFLLVLSGAVRCETGVGWHVHGGGASTVGEFEALAGIERRFRAVAEKEVRALRIQLGPFYDILEDHITMAMAFLRVLAEEALELAERLARADQGKPAGGPR